MKKAFFVIITLFAVLAAEAQYEVVKEADGLVISTKWVREKWYKKDSQQVLAVKVENNNATAVTYSFEIDIFQNGVLLESSKVEEKIIKAGAKSMGRFNGISFIPAKLTSDDIASKNYEIEVNDLEVEKMEVKAP